MLLRFVFLCLLSVFSAAGFAAEALSELDAIRLALARDPRLLADEATLRADLARLDWLRGPLSAPAQLESEWEARRFFNGETTSLAALLDLPLYAPGEAQAQRDVATAQQTLSSQQLALRRLQVVQATRLAYRRAAIAAQSADIAAQAQSLAQALQAISEKRLAAGQIARLEHQSVQVDVLAAQTLLLEKQQAATAARNQLGEWMGPLDHVVIAPLETTPKNPITLSSEHPDLSLAQAQLRLGQAQQGLAQRQRWSGLKLGVGAQVNVQGENDPALLLRLSVPIANTRWRKSHQARALADTEQANAGLLLTQRQLQTRLNTALQSQRFLQQRLELVGQQIVLAQTNVQLAQQGFAAGVLDAESAIRAKNRLQQAYSDQLQVQEALLLLDGEGLWLQGVMP